MFNTVLAIKLLRLDPLINRSTFIEERDIVTDLVYIKDKIISMYRELNKYPFNYNLLDRVCKFDYSKYQDVDLRYNFILEPLHCGVYCIAIDTG
jgi:hypothetical protein